MLVGLKAARACRADTEGGEQRPAPGPRDAQHRKRAGRALGTVWGHGACEAGDSGSAQGPACPVLHGLWSHGGGWVERDSREAVGLGGLATPRWQLQGQLEGPGWGGGGSVLRQPLLSPPPTSRFPSSLSSSGPFFSLAVSLFLPSSKDICRTPEEPGVYPRAPLCLPSPTCCSAHSSLRLCLSSSSSSSFYLRVPGSFPLHLRLAPSFPVTLTSTQLLAALATHLARGLAPPPPRPR